MNVVNWLMGRVTARLRRDERGAAMLMCLGFIAFVGAITPALLDYTSTNLRATVKLRELRAGNYAADAFAELAIAKFRQDRNLAACSPSVALGDATTINTQRMRVQCTGTSLDLTVTVCPATAACTASDARLVATVRFGDATPTSSTKITSWSVRK